MYSALGMGSRGGVRVCVLVRGRLAWMTAVDLRPCLCATALMVAAQYPGSSRPLSQFNLSPTGMSYMLRPSFSSSSVHLLAQSTTDVFFSLGGVMMRPFMFCNG